MPVKDLADSDARNQVVADLTQSVRAGGQYFLLISLSCVIATAGLIADSVAVIIGAMLIAPLVPPIMGIGLSFLGNRNSLLTRSTFAVVTGATLAVLLSALLAWFAKALPFDALTSIPSGVESRAHPSPLDLIVGIAGGAAGAYATARPHVATTIAGVAIATAVMPPLCTVGIGIALGERYIWSGGLLLFLANLVAIAAASTLVFAILGFRPRHSFSSGLEIFLSAVLVVGMATLLVVATIRTVDEARNADVIRSTTAAAIDSQIPGAQLVELKSSTAGETLNLQLTVMVPGSVSVNDARVIQEDIAGRLHRKTAIVLLSIPFVSLDPLIPPTNTQTPTRTPAHTATPTQTVRPAATFTPP